MALVIKKGKQSQTLSFGYSCLKELGIKWNLPGLQSVINRVIEVFTNIDTNDIGFEQVDILVDIINAGLGSLSKFNVDGDWIFENPEMIKEVTKAFIDSLPKTESEKKNPAPKK